MKEDSGRRWIFSPVQKKWLLLTPEELVRQLVILFIQDRFAISPVRMKMESTVSVGTFMKRYDLLVFDKEANPLLLVESKSFSTDVKPEHHAQILQYNETLRVPFLLLTNGLELWFAKEPNYLFMKISEDFTWPQNLYL